jgi:hypothetical protein
VVSPWAERSVAWVEEQSVQPDMIQKAQGLCTVPCLVPEPCVGSGLTDWILNFCTECETCLSRLASLGSTGKQGLKSCFLMPLRQTAVVSAAR